MKRFRFGLLAIVAGLAGALLAAGDTVAQQPPAAGRTISIATLAPAGSAWMRVFDAWNRELRRRTNKALSLRFYPGGVQGDESEVIRKIRSNRLDGGAVTAVGLAQIHRPALVFQIPGMFRTFAQLDAARTGLTGELNTAFERNGFILLGWADVGRSHPFSRSPIHGVADMRASHPFVWRDDSVMPAFYTEVGANPVPLQVPEVLTALQTNRIDAFISSALATLSLQWSTRVTHMTDVDVSVLIGATVMGKTQYDALPPDLQQALRETAAQFHTLAVRNIRNDDETARRTMVERGLQVVTLTPAERSQWEDAFSRTRRRLTGQIADAAFVARVQSLAH